MTFEYEPILYEKNLAEYAALNETEFSPEESKEEIVEERKQARIESLLETWEGGSEEAETSDETEAAPVQAADFVIDQEAFAALSFDYLLYQEEETETALEEMITEEAVTEGLTEGGTEGVQ